MREHYSTLNVDLLEALVAVAEQGGYARAARVLHLSQPAVYQRIQRLEAAVGTPVVQREGRWTRLTSYGHVVYLHAREVMRQLELLRDAIDQIDTSVGGTMSVLVGHSLCEFPAPDIWLGFQERHPDLRIVLRISARTPREIDREVRSGAADLGIHSDPSPVRGLEKDAFYEEEFVAVAWPGHRFEDLDVVRPSDFDGEPVIAFRDASESWFARAGVPINPTLVSNSTQGVRSFVERRAGVSILPREHAVQSPGVIARPLEDPPVRRHYVVSRVTPYEPRNVQALRAYILSGDWLRDARVPDAAHAGCCPTCQGPVGSLSRRHGLGI